MTSKDGATSELQVFRAADEHAPVLLVIPAMGTAAGYYDKLGAAFAQRGVHAALFELRGIDTSSVRASRETDFGYGTLIEQDIPPAIDAVRALLPRAPLFLLGHSLGGHLAFLTLARGQLAHEVRGVALVASGLPYHAGWPGAGSPGIRVFARFMKATSMAVGHYPGERLGFAGREARTVISEWAHAVATGEFSFPTTWTGSVPPEQALARVECPVLAVSLARDKLAPSRSTELLLAKVPRCSVSRIRYQPEAGLPEAAGNHNRWPRWPDAVATHVSKWAIGLTRPASVHPPAASSPS
ncbi:alpha/beta fold hydrolase [Pendulispora brunnea]|uniref:Alpha/beta fold hydrolase n=1 Tax=Pendulispora brunnea TaxID=2905690 RepID=A0ABZ2KI01_9BACT